MSEEVTRPTSLVELLAASLDHLEWLNTIPHTLDDCLRIQANEHERERDDGRGLGSGGNAHADPTAAGLRPVAQGDPEAATVDAVVTRMYRAAADLDGAVCEGMGRRKRNPPAPHGRQGMISHTVAALHSAGDGLERVHEGSSPDWSAFLLVLLRSVHDDAAWLRSKGEGIYSTARLESRVRAEQKPLRGCQSCARDTDTPTGDAYFEPTDRYATFCRWCGDYSKAEKALPPLAAVRWMHRYGKRPTSKVLSDASPKPAKVRT